MDIETKINNLVKTTISDLLNGKYKLISTGQYNSKVKHGQSILSIWIANGADYCRIDEAVNGFKFPEFESDEIKKAVFEIATTKTDYMIKLKLKEARNARKESLSKHRENLRLIESLKEELKAFNK